MSDTLIIILVCLGAFAGGISGLIIGQDLGFKRGLKYARRCVELNYPIDDPGEIARMIKLKKEWKG